MPIEEPCQLALLLLVEGWELSSFLQAIKETSWASFIARQGEILTTPIAPQTGHGHRVRRELDP